MKPIQTTALALALAALAPHATHGQEATDGLTGTRVRVTAPHFAPHRVQGVVSTYTDARLEVTEEETGTVYSFPLRSVSRLDPFMGGGSGSTAWYRARLGGFLGGAVGLLAGAVAASMSESSRSPAATVALYGAGGLGAGALLGGVTGAAAPSERWGWVMNPWGYDPELRPGTP
jgi:hypothetical protein